MFNVPESELPCPRSPDFHDLTPVGERRSLGHGDNWAITLGDDGRQYAYPTDTEAFDGRKEVSSLPVILDGPPDDVRPSVIDSPTGTIPWVSPQKSMKCSGLVMIGGVLWAWLRNANPPGRPDGTGCTLSWSRDRGVTWERAGWGFDEIGYPSWMNAGPNYADAQDGFAYFVSPDGPSAYLDDPDLLLGRVPVERIAEREAYTFWTGQGWGGFDERRPVLSDPAGFFRPDLTYNPGLGRYLLSTCTPAGDWSDWWAEDRPGRRPHLAMFEAERPWGPWRTVAYVTDWGDPENRFTPRIAPGWIDTNGEGFELIHSCIPIGPYQLNWQRHTLKRR